jgi:hypothetical protein
MPKKIGTLYIEIGSLDTKIGTFSAKIRSFYTKNGTFYTEIRSKIRPKLLQTKETGGSLAENSINFRGRGTISAFRGTSSGLIFDTI